MIDLKLVHYSKEPLTPLYYHEQKEQHPNGMYQKPQGLWISDDDDYGWKEWCDDENYEIGISRCKYVTDIIIKSGANILFLGDIDKLIQFTKDYQITPWSINWIKVAKKYQGIIVTPYLYELRLDARTSWYYTWDCSSGCIWDTSSIELGECKEVM
jgi:hypothetical protein